MKLAKTRYTILILNKINLVMKCVSSAGLMLIKFSLKLKSYPPLALIIIDIHKLVWNNFWGEILWRIR